MPDSPAPTISTSTCCGSRSAVVAGAATSVMRNLSSAINAVSTAYRGCRHSVNSATLASMATEPRVTKPRRIRRLPDAAKREILDAAEALLSERSFRELSVDDLMASTGMTRSSFYHYFRSLDEVAIALMRRVRGEMREAASPWLQLGYDGAPAAGAGEGIRASAEVFARHGLVLAAIHEASFRYGAVQRAWREGVLEDWIHAIADQLRAQRER